MHIYCAPMTGVLSLANVSMAEASCWRLPGHHAARLHLVRASHALRSPSPCPQKCEEHAAPYLRCSRENGLPRIAHTVQGPSGLSCRMLQCGRRAHVAQRIRCCQQCMQAHCRSTGCGHPSVSGRIPRSLGSTSWCIMRLCTYAGMAAGCAHMSTMAPAACFTPVSIRVSLAACHSCIPMLTLV